MRAITGRSATLQSKMPTYGTRSYCVVKEELLRVRASLGVPGNVPMARYVSPGSHCVHDKSYVLRIVALGVLDCIGPNGLALTVLPIYLSAPASPR